MQLESALAQKIENLERAKEVERNGNSVTSYQFAEGESLTREEWILKNVQIDYFQTPLLFLNQYLPYQDIGPIAH